MKSLYSRLFILALMPVIAFSQTNRLQSFSHTSRLQNFPLSSVHLLESPFQQAQETDLKYMLALDPDRLLAPFLREAGIEPKAKGYGNWEGTGLDGHIGGHYLSALSNMYAATGNQEVQRRLNYMIDWIEKCQQQSGDGYVGGIPGGKAMWKDVANGKIDAGGFSLNGKWVPWYNIHKLYAGLVDAYVLTGNTKAKDILIKLSDWCLELTSHLSDQQMQQMMRSEHGGMNEVFADVAAITGDQKYLELAKRFSHRFILNPLLQHKDSLTGLHANTQIPKVIGYARIAEVGGDQSWEDAADFFWQTVVAHRTVSIGGNSVREHFHPANNFTSMVEDKEGPETCNTYNMLKLSKHLFLYHPSASYMDYYERSLYNHILSSQHPHGGFVYFTPMRPRHYRVYSQPDKGFWCCVGSGMENHGKYGELIYAHNDKDVFVNLFIPSTLAWKERGISITQKTKFPFEEKSTIQLKLQKPMQFALHVRYPSWVKNGRMKVLVNGKEVKLTKDTASYVAINRLWKSGDVVTLSLPMETKVERLPDGSDWVSFVRGPIVLAAATDTTNLVGLRADDSRMGHIANGPLYPIETAPLLVSSQKDVASALQQVPGKPLTFTASSLIYPAQFKNLQLVPFFTVHDARYIIYWPITNPEGLEKRKQTIREAEEARLALEARTVDQVAPGEQQPESDHNFQGEKTESGVFLDRHWRHASGWFSYDLKNRNKEGHVLRITYSGRDRNRSFDIYVNDKLFKTVNMDANRGDGFYDVDYELPSDILNSLTGETMTVKFVAHSGSVAGGIYYVRLLK
ncbi:glycoside hydrolase family 127 protein [Chitinophagaceae bacterium LB-8]|uniref:Glycoside hydrolase family 127 protein n=1 Tax=Paraflavisolibacter caeni TaxID=2982496 RepID=A0A9X2XW73_9BACT|nr:glycoside hydrolase family 127 protein [Paraflavisolibacter caeni]MCU7550075.1 glycoside hydrolase family 127 protein [Paraflavisolibacter caeni]